ncbi:hypothetical protein Agub_g444, partial [Astrephomene gubernaculifera]
MASIELSSGGFNKALYLRWQRALVRLIFSFILVHCACGLQPSEKATSPNELGASFRILVVPVAWRSRAFPMLKVSYELAARGHAVTVLLPQVHEAWARDSFKSFARARARRENIFSSASLDLPSGLTLLLRDAWDMEAGAEVVANSSPIEQFRYVLGNTLDNCRRLLANDTINQLVADGRFDIFFGDMMDSCGSTVAEFWRLPRVDYDSGDCRAGWHFNIYNQPFSPAVTTSYLVPVPTNTALGLKDRLANLGATVLLRLVHTHWVLPALESFRRSLNATSYLRLLPPDHPALQQQPQLSSVTEVNIKRLLMVIVNVDWAFHDVRSIGPHFKYVGPMNADVPAPLPPALHSFVSEGGDRSDPRVIYVSPGSTFSFGDPGQAHLMLALLSLPGRYRIVWRARPAHRSLLSARLTALGHPGLMEVAQQPSSPPSPSARLLLLDWAPQNDLLGQPGLALFVSHCGINGVNEAVFHGVPVLCVPIMGEQPLNGAMIKSFGNGRSLAFAKLNGANGQTIALQEIRTILEDPSYSLTSLLLSARMRSHPLPPVLRAAHWVEAAAAAARAGPPGFLVPAEALLPWWRLGLVEV